MSQAGIIAERDSVFSLTDNANVIFVDKAGNDANSGLNINESKLTIQGAVDVAGVNATVFINPGTYTETVTFTEDGQVLVGRGRPHNVVITQADANVIDANTKSNCDIKNIQLSVTAATSIVDTVKVSTGSVILRDCKVSMTSTADIVSSEQPACAYVSGAGEYKMRGGSFVYSNSGDCGTSSLKSAFRVGDDGLVQLKDACCSEVNTSGTSAVSSIALDIGTGIVDMDSCKVVLTCGGSLVIGLAYIGGTGLTHHFGYNEIEIDATGASSAFGFFSGDTASTSYLFFNHIHVYGATSNYAYIVGAGSTLNSTFNNIVAADGITVNGTLNEVDSIVNGELVVGNIKLADNTISTTTGDLNLNPDGVTVLEAASYSALDTMQSSVNAFPVGTSDGLMKANIKGLSLYNSVVNGDFSNGTTDWNNVNCTLAESSNIMSITGNGGTAVPYADATFNPDFLVDGMYFIYAKARVTNSDCTIIDVGNLTIAPTGYISVTNPIINTWYEFYGIRTASSETESNFRLIHRYADTATATGAVMEVDGTAGVFSINMTKLGIADYTEAQMLELVQQGYFEGYKESYPEITTAHIKAEQSVTNGDFNTSTTDWNGAGRGASLSVSDNMLSVTGDGSKTYCQAQYVGSSTATIGDTYFVYAKVSVDSSSCEKISINRPNGTGIDILTPTSGVDYEIYIKAVADQPELFWIAHHYADVGTASGKVMTMDGTVGVFAINMTQSGIEDKTEAEMLEFIQTTGYFEGEKTDRENVFNPAITLRSLPDGTQDSLQNASDDLSSYLDDWRYTQRVSAGEAILSGVTISRPNLPSMVTGSSYLIVLDSGGIQTGTEGTDTASANGSIYYELADKTPLEIELDQLYAFEDGYLFQNNGTLLNEIDYSLTQNINARLDSLSHAVEDLDDRSIVLDISRDKTARGLDFDFVANEAQAFGDFVYIASDGDMAIADASAIATAGALFMCSSTSIAADATGKYIRSGIARDDSWTWSASGVPIYLSLTGASGSTLTETAPTLSGECVTLIGYALTSTTMFFEPNSSVIEIA